MKAEDEEVKYVPGFYAKKRPGAADLANRYIREWEDKKLVDKKKKAKDLIHPTICFSREIGVGALEVADILGEMMGYRVVDRQLIEHISEEAKLSEKTVQIFDESYPGKMNECLTYLFGEKAFIKSDYTRHLFSGIFAIAGLGPTIFVGRGAHLVLPRENVLAVRLISSRQYRIKRLAKILKAKEDDVDAKLNQLDKEQKNFFKRVYGKKDASSPHEFDLVINFDYFKEPRMVAEIVALAFQQKYGAMVKKK
jgi:hypothetical protein